MNELWMRVGMTFRLTDEEVEAILNPKDGEVSMRAIIRRAFDEGRFELCNKQTTIRHADILSPKGGKKTNLTKL